MPTPRHIKVGRSQTQQYHQEAMWEIFKYIANRPIMSNLSKLEYDDDDDDVVERYFKNMESDFISLASRRGVPKKRIKASKAYRVICKITRKHDISGSSIKRTLTQLRTCAARKTKNPRFL